MSNIAKEMAMDHAILDADKMSKAELIRFVESRTVCTRSNLLTMDDYFDKAVELLFNDWVERSE